MPSPSPRHDRRFNRRALCLRGARARAPAPCRWAAPFRAQPHLAGLDGDLAEPRGASAAGRAAHELPHRRRRAVEWRARSRNSKCVYGPSRARGVAMAGSCRTVTGVSSSVRAARRFSSSALSAARHTHRLVSPAAHSLHRIASHRIVSRAVPAVGAMDAQGIAALSSMLDESRGAAEDALDGGASSSGARQGLTPGAIGAPAGAKVRARGSLTRPCTRLGARLTRPRRLAGRGAHSGAVIWACAIGCWC